MERIPARIREARHYESAAEHLYREGRNAAADHLAEHAAYLRKRHANILRGRRAA